MVLRSDVCTTAGAYRAIVHGLVIVGVSETMGMAPFMESAGIAVSVGVSSHVINIHID